MSMDADVLFTKEDFVPGEEMIAQLSRKNDVFSFHQRFIHEAGIGKYPTGKYATGNIISNFDKTNGLMVSINYAPDEHAKYWSDNLYYTSICMEKIASEKQVLFPFLLHVLRLYPKAKVGIDDVDWFYTLADLEQLAARLGRFDSWHEIKNPALEDLQGLITAKYDSTIWYVVDPKEFYL
jgi:hypothetical protein